MIRNIPALPSPVKVFRDAARATKRVALLAMKKLSTETLNELLGLPELVVTEYALEQQDDSETVHIFCEHRHEVALCPRCGEASTKVHERMMRSVRHLDIWGKTTVLHFLARRFACQRCDKPFTETLSWLEEGRRHSQAFELHIYGRCQQSSLEAIARAEQLHPEVEGRTLSKPLPQDVREQSAQFFRGNTLKLQELFRRDLSLWPEAKP